MKKPKTLKETLDEEAKEVVKFEKEINNLRPGKSIVYYVGAVPMDRLGRAKLKVVMDAYSAGKVVPLQKVVKRSITSTGLSIYEYIAVSSKTVPSRPKGGLNESF